MREECSNKYGRAYFPESTKEVTPLSISSQVPCGERIVQRNRGPANSPKTAKQLLFGRSMHRNFPNSVGRDESDFHLISGRRFCGLWVQTAVLERKQAST